MPPPEPEAFARAFAERIGEQPLSTEQFNAVLDLAGAAARASARQAAPVCCWLAAAAGVSPEEAQELATALGAELGDA